MKAPSNKDKAVAIALDQARTDAAALESGSNAWKERCRRLGLTEPQDGALALRFMERNTVLDTGRLTFTPSLDPLREILILRYLVYGGALPDNDAQPLAYRELPGASFYLGPFRSRSVEPLARAAGNDLETLGRVLEEYDATPLERGDAAWRVPVMGRIWLELVCYEPDEEFPAGCELFFAPAVARVYSADEAAMLGQIFCLGLLPKL